MVKDQEIEVADRLLADGYIDKGQRALLKTRGGKVWDNKDFPVDVCENGDVYVHGGAYPLILRGYANR